MLRSLKPQPFSFKPKYSPGFTYKEGDATILYKTI